MRKWTFALLTILITISFFEMNKEEACSCPVHSNVMGGYIFLCYAKLTHYNVKQLNMMYMSWWWIL